MELKKALEQLNPTDRAVVILRLGLEGRCARTEQKTAELLGLSRKQVSRHLKRGMMQLRKYGLPEGL